MAEMDEIEDGKIEVIGKEVDEVPEGTALPLAIWVQAAGRKMQSDFEPILERQIHHLINQAEGVWHMGQRDIVWTRISKASFARGFRLRHYGEIIHAKFLSEYPAIVDKVQVTLITDEAEVQRRLEHARHVYVERNRRLESMTDESVDTFYSCLLCQSFAPNHVCVITPERLGLCGAYNWLDGKAAFEIDDTGPNQPIAKGRCLDPVRGMWEGVNEFVYKNSHKALESFSAYSIMDRPMTSCGCFEAICAYVPECNGVMIVNREFMGDTPVGMAFSTLAGSVGGGAQTPGFMGIGKAFISSRKFMFAEGGVGRIVWMPKELKQVVAEDLGKIAKAQGVEDLLDLIADESVATDPQEIRAYLEKVGHPALKMPDMASLWADAEIPVADEELAAEETPAVPGVQVAAAGANEKISESDQTVMESEPEVMAASAADVVGGNGKLVAPDMAALLETLKAQIKSELKTEISRDVVGEIINSLNVRFLGGEKQDPGTATVKPPPQARAEKKDEPAKASTGKDEQAAQAALPAAQPKTETVKQAAPAVTAAPALHADEKLAAVRGVKIPRETASEVIEVITLGATPAEGGTRGRSVKIGGQNCMPFHFFEGTMPNKPVLALEVFDTVSPKMAVLLRETWGADVLADPARMAKRAVAEFGAEMVAVRLEGTHPEKGGRKPRRGACHRQGRAGRGGRAAHRDGAQPF